MASLQNLPDLGTAEADVLFVEWLVAEGAPVRRGEPLATVETLKAAFEIECERDGVLLRRLVAAGQRVPTQRPIAVFGTAGEVVDEAWLAAHAGGERSVAAQAAPVAATAVVVPQPFGGAVAAPVAPAARQRARELGVDVTTVAGSGPEGLVRVADVERHHAAQATDRGRVDPQFLAFVRQETAAFAALGSEFKIALYRRHGAEIGDGARIGPGSVLLCERLVLGPGAAIGRDCTIEVHELVAGSLLHFGARCRVRCRRATFGDNAFFADDVEIGGGGALEPEAELVVGSHGFVGEHTHLNPCRRLQIGDEVVVSRSAVVMTHSFGPSWLRGYPSRFAPVTVGDGAQLGIAAVLFPGVEVGAGAVILSGSSVVTSVPPGRLFGGVPAQDLKAAAQVLTAAELRERARSLVLEFARQLALRGRPVRTRDEAGGVHLLVVADDGEHVLEYAPVAAAAPTTASSPEQVIVAVEFDEARFSAMPAAVTAIGLEPPRVRGPLGPLAAAFREFLRKRGVRLHPRAWAYRGGWW